MPDIERRILFDRRLIENCAFEPDAVARHGPKEVAAWERRTYFYWARTSALLPQPMEIAGRYHSERYVHFFRLQMPGAQPFKLGMSVKAGCWR
jgi:hypothetical protein